MKIIYISKHLKQRSNMQLYFFSFTFHVKNLKACTLLNNLESNQICFDVENMLKLFLLLIFKQSSFNC